jgi:hypothetical protein
VSWRGTRRRAAPEPTAGRPQRSAGDRDWSASQARYAARLREGLRGVTDPGQWAAASAVANPIEQGCRSTGVASGAFPPQAGAAAKKMAASRGRCPRGDLPMRQGRQRILHQPSAEGKDTAARGKGPAAKVGMKLCWPCRHERPQVDAAGTSNSTNVRLTRQKF